MLKAAGTLTLIPSSRGNSLSHLIVFTLGYFLGGVTALVVMGLAVAARRGDRGAASVLGGRTLCRI